MKQKVTKKTKGWGNQTPFRSNGRFHYFVDGMSLCRRWAFARCELEEGKDDHPDNCAACKRLKAKLQT